MILHIAGLSIQPNVWQAAVIVGLILIFLLGLSLISRNFMHHSPHGIWIGILVGFIFAITLEGLLLINGKTILTSLLMVRNAPRPVQNVLDVGHKQLLEVLNVPASCSGAVK